MSSIIDQLAVSLGHKDEVPNIELAQKIAASADKNAVKELVDNLDNKNKNIAFDCIKTLYEIGYQKPELISGYAKDFIDQLKSKHGRMVWGAMTAISAIAALVPDVIYSNQALIIDTADNSGSVIARDHTMYILAALAKHEKYYDDCMALILEQLLKSPVNQLPMYAEITAPIVATKDKDTFKKVLQERLKNITQESKIKRIEKVLKKL